MATIDNQTGEAVSEQEPQADNVLRMPDSADRAERVKAQRPHKHRPKSMASMQKAATDFAETFPDELGSSVDQATEGATLAMQGAEQVMSAGKDIGKLLLFGLGVWVFLEMTADRSLKRYAED